MWFMRFENLIFLIDRNYIYRVISTSGQKEKNCSLDESI